MNSVIVAMLLVLSNGDIVGGAMTNSAADCAATATQGVQVMTDHPEMLEGATLVCKGLYLDPDGNIVYQGE